MGRIFGPELEQVLPTSQQKMTRLQKILAPFQVWRSVKSGFDNSALGRQGRKVMFSDPAEWWRSIGPNLRAMRSQEGYETVMEQVRAAEHYSLGQSLERPLGIMEQGSSLADEWLSSITSTNNVLRVILGPFERAYLGWLNVVRQAIFDKDVNSLIRAYKALDQVPIEEIQRASDNINNATMFGNLSKLQDSQRLIGQTFFSARGLVAPAQFLADFVRVMRPGADPTMRKIIARRFAAHVGSSVGTLIAANYAGYALNEQGIPVPLRAELNPWSGSFGEIRAGPVKFNPWGSDAPFIRAAIQWASARQLSEGEKDPHKASRNEVAERLIQSKLSPAAGLGFDLL